MPPEKIDVLRSRAEALDNSSESNPDEVRDAYDALTSLAAETKEEKELVSEALERNRGKIIDTQLVRLQSFEEKLAHVSTIDMGDHIGSAARSALDATQSAATATMELGKTGFGHASKGAAITFDYAKDVFNQAREKHPVALGVAATVGGAAAVYGLMRLYKWIAETDTEPEKRSFFRSALKTVGIGAVAAGALALVGISAKEAVATPPVQTPDTSTPTPTPPSALESLNQAGVPVELSNVPEGVNILDLAVPIIIGGKHVKFEKGGLLQHSAVHIDGVRYELQTVTLNVGIGLLSKITRTQNGLVFGSNTVSDAEIIRLITEVDGKETAAVDVGYQDKNQQSQNVTLELKKV